MFHVIFLLSRVCYRFPAFDKGLKDGVEIFFSRSFLMVHHSAISVTRKKHTFAIAVLFIVRTNGVIPP